jgi:hypothetical protein
VIRCVAERCHGCAMGHIYTGAACNRFEILRGDA